MFGVHPDFTPSIRLIFIITSLGAVLFGGSMVGVGYLILSSPSEPDELSALAFALIGIFVIGLMVLFFSVRLKRLRRATAMIRSIRPIKLLLTIREQARPSDGSEDRLDIYATLRETNNPAPLFVNVPIERTGEPNRHFDYVDEPAQVYISSHRGDPLVFQVHDKYYCSAYSCPSPTRNLPSTAS